MENTNKKKKNRGKIKMKKNKIEERANQMLFDFSKLSKKAVLS